MAASRPTGSAGGAKWSDAYGGGVGGGSAVAAAAMLEREREAYAANDTADEPIAAAVPRASPVASAAVLPTAPTAEPSVRAVVPITGAPAQWVRPNGQSRVKAARVKRVKSPLPDWFNGFARQPLNYSSGKHEFLPPSTSHACCASDDGERTHGVGGGAHQSGGDAGGGGHCCTGRSCSQSSDPQCRTRIPHRHAAHRA